MAMGLGLIFRVDESCIAAHAGERAVRSLGDDDESVFGDGDGDDIGDDIGDDGEGYEENVSRADEEEGKEEDREEEEEEEGDEDGDEEGDDEKAPNDAAPAAAYVTAPEVNEEAEAKKLAALAMPLSETKQMK